IVNLETSITTSEAYVPKGINYRMHPQNVPCLATLGVDGCVLANNHVLDWGEAGLIETLQVLADIGIKTPGAGRNAAEAAAPAIFEVERGVRVIVAAFCTTSSGVPAGWAAGADRAGVHLVAAGVPVGDQLG